MRFAMHASISPTDLHGQLVADVLHRAVLPHALQDREESTAAAVDMRRTQRSALP
jgi:hypothetical protein